MIQRIDKWTFCKIVSKWRVDNFMNSTGHYKVWRIRNFLALINLLVCLNIHFGIFFKKIQQNHNLCCSIPWLVLTCCSYLFASGSFHSWGFYQDFLSIGCERHADECLVISIFYLLPVLCKGQREDSENFQLQEVWEIFQSSWDSWLWKGSSW
jgi:hypothetical protein